MPPAEAFAYPLLLAAIYGAYRVGRVGGVRRATPLEWARLAFLALALATVALVQVRLAATGFVLSPWGLAAGMLSVAAVFALLGLHALDLRDAMRRARVT